MAKLRVVFMGTGDIGLPTLRFLLSEGLLQTVGVVTQPDRPVGRAQTVTPPAPKRLAAEAGVPVLQPERLRRPEAVEALRALAPDLVVVMAYGQILPKSVLDLPTVACLNLHASLLPRHRGAAPIQAAILAGDRESGITVMHMAEGLDTGDVVLRRVLPIRRRETGGSLHDRLADLAPAALAEALPPLLAGNAPRERQDDASATYAAKLDRDSGRIDWAAPGGHLDLLVRAMDPWPGSWTTLHEPGGEGRRLKIHRALPVHRAHGKPGVIIRISDRGVLVGAGTGGLLLREAQLEGKRRLPAEVWARGARLVPGAQLGE